MKLRFRVYIGLFVSLIILTCFYLLWSPGDKELKDKNNFKENGMWLSHGWIGDDEWFKKNKRDPSQYDLGKQQLLREKVERLKIKFIFPHLCPANHQGSIPKIDIEKLKSLKKNLRNCKIYPWIGGSTEDTVDYKNEKWKSQFLKSIKLLSDNELIDGFHLNFEPLPNGDVEFIELLKEIKNILGIKPLSIAAYPPTTIFHPYPQVHWDLNYYKEISKIVDQIVPMLYDTSLKNKKIYTNLVRQWTCEIIHACPGSQILFGIPAYDDPGVGYHDPDVENSENALLGIVSGINSQGLNKTFGISVYSEWTLDDEKIKIISEFMPK